MRRSRFLRTLKRATSGLILAMGLPTTVTACRQSASPPQAASVAETAPQPLVAQSEPKATWRVAIAQGLRPFIIEKDDLLVGFDIDLIKAIGEVCGVTLKLERQPFDALAALIRAEQIEMAMGAVPITPEQSGGVEFSRPYFHSGVAITALPTNAQLTTPKALSGKTIAVTLGTAGAQLAIDVLGSTILTFDQAADTLTAVKKGEADAALIALPVLLDIQATQADYADLQTMGKLIDPYDFGIMVRSEPSSKPSSKSSSEASANSSVKTQTAGDDRLRAVDGALKTLVKDGTYADIHERWLGTAPVEQPF
ncbi:MAG: transporter substrate-binding domain-containing protein [Phormidesmis sp.]